MRYVVFTIVIIISCSVCVFGDLEIYPGINLEDQHDESSDANFVPLFTERRRNEKENWPRLQQEYFSNGQTPRKFNDRIAESYRKIRDMLNKQAKVLKERVHNSMKNFVLPENSNEEFSVFLSDELDRSKYHKQHILEDVRPYPQDISDFSFRDDYGSENILDEEDENIERIRDVSYYADENIDSDSSRKQPYYDSKPYDPTYFAYPPSDPRFYEDIRNPEIKTQRETFNKDMKDLNDQQENLHGESDNSRISYTGAYQEIMDDPRERTDSVKVVAVRPNATETDSAGVYIIAIVAGISAAATVGLIAFGIGWYNLQKHVKNASDVEYPAYGIIGPNKDISPSGDRRLAQSAQMYHYQHQKQQIIAMERAADNERRGSVSEADSDEENEEGDYTVYEYAGLASIGEMEVKNPLFQDDTTPAQTSALKSSEDNQKK